MHAATHLNKHKMEDNTFFKPCTIVHLCFKIMMPRYCCTLAIDYYSTLQVKRYMIGHKTIILSNYRYRTIHSEKEGDRGSLNPIKIILDLQQLLSCHLKKLPHWMIRSMIKTPNELLMLLFSCIFMWNACILFTDLYMFKQFLYN